MIGKILLVKNYDTKNLIYICEVIRVERIPDFVVQCRMITHQSKTKTVYYFPCYTFSLREGGGGIQNTQKINLESVLMKYQSWWWRYFQKLSKLLIFARLYSSGFAQLLCLLLTRPDRALLPRFYKSSVQWEDLKWFWISNMNNKSPFLWYSISTQKRKADLPFWIFDCFFVWTLAVALLTCTKLT